MTLTDAYSSGATAALDTYGIRTAADLMGTRMPDGPESVGAEWLSKRLRGDNEDHTHVVGSRPSHRKLERPASWGGPSSLESAGSNMHNYSGIGQYGGV